MHFSSLFFKEITDDGHPHNPHISAPFFQAAYKEDEPDFGAETPPWQLGEVRSCNLWWFWFKIFKGNNDQESRQESRKHITSKLYPDCARKQEAVSIQCQAYHLICRLWQQDANEAWIKERWTFALRYILNPDTSPRVYWDATWQRLVRNRRSQVVGELYIMVIITMLYNILIYNIYIVSFLKKYICNYIHILLYNIIWKAASCNQNMGTALLPASNPTWISPDSDASPRFWAWWWSPTTSFSCLWRFASPWKRPIF